MTVRRARPGDAKLAIAYLRVSTEEQRLGPEAQRAAIEAWAARDGVAVLAWHADQGVSGASELDDRSGLIAAIGQLRAVGAGVLVVAKRDRLARDVAVAVAIDRAARACGAAVVSADGNGNGDSPAAEFMRVLLDGAAQYERRLIAARTVAALGAKRAQGQRVGGVPFGWRADDGGWLLPDPAEQSVIEQVRELRATGLSLRAVAAQCARLGLRSRSGTAFGATQLHRMLRSSGRGHAGAAPRALVPGSGECHGGCT
jgi:site-specific DNA recombinase